MKREKWIIGVGGSEMDGVALMRAEGTIDDIKKRLVSSVLGERALYDDDDWDFGTESVSEVEEREDGSLFAFSCFKDFHTDYEATPERLIPNA